MYIYEFIIVTDFTIFIISNDALGFVVRCLNGLNNLLILLIGFIALSKI